MLLLLKLALSNLLVLGLHFDGKNNFPKQLSAAEEAECIKAAADGDKKAMDKLIIHNLRLVAYIVKKNYPDAHDPDDLVSIGTLGLIRAAETFDYSKGNQFSTYASKCIDNQIKMYFRKIKHRQNDVSISDPIDCDSEGNSLTIEDIFASSINVENTAEIEIDTQRLYGFMAQYLTEREREIICKRYGIMNIDGSLCKPMPQREIAKEMKISRSYVSRIEKRAIEKLQKCFNSKEFH